MDNIFSQLKRSVLLIGMLFIPVLSLFSQHTSKNNYTGAWETPTSWDPTWAVPQTSISGFGITINGYITVTGSLTFSGTAGNLIVNDTLVIKGNLTLGSNNDVIINDNGILIIRGDLIIDNQTNIVANGYFVIIGNLIKNSSINQGSFTSNDNPVKVFIGGIISAVGITDNNPLYPVVNIVAPPTTTYPNSTYCYGNMADILNDPIYSLFQSTCTIAKATSNSPVCAGNTIKLVTSGGTGYSWSGPDSFTNNLQSPSIPNAGAAMAGTYTVTVTAAQGCSNVTETTNVVVNELPIATGSSNSPVCAGNTINLFSSGGESYNWRGPNNFTSSEQNPSISNANTAGTGAYIVTVTGTNGCTVTKTINVVVNALPITPTITASGPTAFCPGGSVTLTSSAGTGYLWSTGATTASINVTTAGSYTVRVTNLNGCQSALSVATIVTVTALPVTPTITAVGPTTFCAGGSVQLTSSEGTSYLWSNGETTQSINVTTAGSYTVRVANASGCQSKASVATIVTVTALPVTPTITASGPKTFCDGGSVTLTSSAGTSYLWSDGSTTAGINVTASESYTVQVTNASGCQSAASVATIVTVNTLPVTPTITAGGPTTFCAGGNVTLTSSVGTSYLWSTGATTASINVLTAGSYNVQVTDANGCQSAISVATIVTINALPVTPTIIADRPTTFCAGSSVTLTSSAGTSYLWSTGAITASINVTTAGSYNVRITDANGCQSTTSAAMAVNVNALPVVNAGTDVTIPNGTSTTLNATVTGTVPFTYSWTPSSQLVNALVEDPTTINLTTSTVFTLTATSAITSCSNTSEVTVTISGGPLSSTPTTTPGTVCAGKNVQLHALPSGGSGIYTYTWTSTPVGFTSSVVDPVANPTVNTIYYVTVDDGFTTVNSQVAVTVDALPATPTITVIGTTTFCAGGSVNLISSAEESYLWSNGATTASINVITTGNYTVQVTNLSGCQSAASLPTLVTVNALPVTPTISSGGSTTFCAGGGVQLTSSAGASYLWSTGATTAIINATTAGNYTVQITNANGCQSAASAATIATVNALPATPTITANGPITFCAGGSVQLTSSAGTSYLWSTGETKRKIKVTTTGSYTVRVTNASGCQSGPSAATTVTVNALPITPTISAGGPTTFCAGSSVTLTSSAGASYLWSNGATTAFINVTTTGSYTVKVTNASGCQSTVSAATSVTVNALPVTPTITAGGPTTFCAGYSVTLTSSAGASYLWSTGATTSTINATITGSYTVRVTTASGCQSAASVATIVTVNTLPLTPTITADGPITFCAGSSVTIASSAEAYYLWSEGTTTANIMVTTAGSYTIRVTNTNGCQSAVSAVTIVTVNALPVTPTITVSGPTTLCDGGSVTLTSVAGASYLWSDGETTQSINVTTAGRYSVRVSNSNLCRSEASVAIVVVVNPLPQVSASNNSPLCAGNTINLTSSGAPTFSWSGPNGFTSAQQSPSIPNADSTMAGTYTVTVTAATGCSARQITNVLVKTRPVATAGSNSPLCAGYTLNLTSSGGLSYYWSGPNGYSATVQNPSIVAASAVSTGTYSVTVTAANGCTNSAFVNAVVNPLPPVSIISSGSPMCVNDKRTITGNQPGGIFTVTSGPGTVSGEILSATGVGNIILEYKYTSLCTNLVNQSIVVTEQPYANAGPDQVLKFVYETYMKSELSSNETGEWTLVSGSGNIQNIHSPVSAITGLSNGTNIFLWTVRNGNCEASATIGITVEDLFIPSVITPNGDGRNDFFMISALSGQVELVVFNRWGNVEYRNRNYLNDWDGLNDKGGQMSNDTYMYVLRFQNGTTRKGTVLITR